MDLLSTEVRREKMQRTKNKHTKAQCEYVTCFKRELRSEQEKYFCRQGCMLSIESNPTLLESVHFSVVRQRAVQVQPVEESAHCFFNQALKHDDHPRRMHEGGCRSETVAGAASTYFRNCQSIFILFYFLNFF